jgi:hypothetical protein
VAQEIATLGSDFYDAELRLHNEHLRAAANVQPHDRVLDVGWPGHLHLGRTPTVARALRSGARTYRVGPPLVCTDPPVATDWYTQT